MNYDQKMNDAFKEGIAYNVETKKKLEVWKVFHEEKWTFNKRDAIISHDAGLNNDEFVKKMVNEFNATPYQMTQSELNTKKNFENADRDSIQLGTDSLYLYWFVTYVNARVTFPTEEDAKAALEWTEGMIVMNQLSGPKKKSFTIQNTIV